LERAENQLEIFDLEICLACRNFTWNFLYFQAEEEDEDDDLPRKDEL
jgi:hypothetical protein